MGLIGRLFNYKSKVVEKVISNEDVIKALIDNSPDFIDSAIPVDFDKDSLIDSQVYSYVPTMTILNDAQSYVFVSTGKTISKSGKDYVIGELTITVLCPNASEVMKTYSGERTGFIGDKIDEMIFQTRGFGLGEIGKRSTEEFTVDSESKFVGMIIKYEFTDFSV